MSGDNIDSLPTDDGVLSHSEVQLMDHLFQHHHNSIQNMLGEMQDLVLMVLIFMIISLPQIDTQISKFLPLTTDSVYMMILAKAFLFVGIYFILKNLYLVRKK